MPCAPSCATSAKAQSYLSSWQRATADFQNLKRRMEGERSEVGRIANAAFVINLLPLVVDLERALHTIDSNLAGLTWIDGVWLIYRKFQQVLENAGVRKIQGRRPAPSTRRVHEAISKPRRRGESSPWSQRSARLGDRVVRPAMVVVGRGHGSGSRVKAKTQRTRCPKTGYAGTICGDTRPCRGDLLGLSSDTRRK